MYNKVFGQSNSCQICFDKNVKIQDNKYENNFTDIIHCSKCLRPIHKKCIELQTSNFIYHNNFQDCKNCPVMFKSHNDFQRCSICHQASGILVNYPTLIYSNGNSYFKNQDKRQQHPICLDQALNNFNFIKRKRLAGINQIEIKKDNYFFNEQEKIQCDVCKFKFGYKIKCQYCNKHAHPQCAAVSLKQDFNITTGKMACHHIDKSEDIEILKIFQGSLKQWLTNEDSMNDLITNYKKYEFGWYVQLTNVQGKICNINVIELQNIYKKPIDLFAEENLIKIQEFENYIEKCKQTKDQEIKDIDKIIGHNFFNHTTQYLIRVKLNQSQYIDYQHESFFYRDFKKVSKQFNELGINQNKNVHLFQFADVQKILNNKFDSHLNNSFYDIKKLFKINNHEVICVDESQNELNDVNNKFTYLNEDSNENEMSDQIDKQYRKLQFQSN